MSQKKKTTFREEFYKFLGLLALVVFIRSSILGLYVIPTGSMLPSIKLDDRLIANNLAYGLMLPLAETQIVSWGTPKRGDIVLFKTPKGEERHTLVKRVVGVAGDKITFRMGTLHINGEPVKEVEQTDRTVLNDMGTLEDLGRAGEGKTLYLETFPGSSEPHYMMRFTVGGQTYADTQEYVVPEGKLLCIGDNRDDSADGRRFGMVDADKIYGKALFVFYSTIPHDGLLPNFRTDRFFTALK